MKLNVHEAKTHLSKFLARVENGEIVTLCRWNVPIAEIRPLPKARTTPRPIGLDKGKFEIDSAFFEPLPDDIAAFFTTASGKP